MAGIRLHADQAVVNVNFWITPDSANRNPGNGGLVVWNKKPPADWDFARANADDKSARELLQQTGAIPVTVPYRANRAVIFDSDLFHETDEIEFSHGYENRRINVTMLFGRQGGPANHKNVLRQASAGGYIPARQARRPPNIPAPFRPT